MAESIPLIWTNDDISFGQSEQLERQLAMLDRLGVPGVFFVIPETPGKGKISDDPTLIRTIESARARGHEFYQHGHIHTPFESGVPETWMLAFAPDVRDEYDVRRLEIEKQHTFDAQRAMLERGQQIWRDAFGEASVGYRPGWGAFCGNLYKAAADLGYQWTSSRITYPTSWVWNQMRFDVPITFREGVPLHPYRVEGEMWEFPLGGDYAFRIPNEPDKIDKMVGLAMREFEHYLEQGAPMPIVSHWHGLQFGDNGGYAVHEKLLPTLQATGRAEWIGMAELHRRTEAANADPAVEGSGSSV